MRARVSRLWFSREKAADVERKAAAARFSPDGSFAKKKKKKRKKVLGWVRELLAIKEDKGSWGG